MNIDDCVCTKLFLNIHVCRLTADEYSSLCSNLFANILLYRLPADEYSSLCSSLLIFMFVG